MLIAYDSDVMTNPKVHAALADIGGYLAYKGADVRYCYLPADGDAEVGLDDYLAAGGCAGWRPHGDPQGSAPRRRLLGARRHAADWAAVRCHASPGR